MKTVLLIIASIVTIGSVMPYARDILKGTTRPNIVSWITWTLLTSIATVAEIVDHQYVTAVFTASAVLETATIVILGLKYGFVTYTQFNWVSFTYAVYIVLINALLVIIITSRIKKILRKTIL